MYLKSLLLTLLLATLLVNTSGNINMGELLANQILANRKLFAHLFDSICKKHGFIQSQFSIITSPYMSGGVKFFLAQEHTLVKCDIVRKED